MGILLLTGRFVGCASRIAGDNRGESQMPAKTIEEVLKEYTDAWMSIPGVVGTALGECEGKPCIKIFVAKKEERLAQQIPSQVEGFPVILEETGEFRALGPD